MSHLRSLNPLPYLLGKLSRFAVGLLTKPIARYTLTIPNDMVALTRSLRKGDVILVEGNERVSECIKYLTQSCWSHSALYVGDEPLRRSPEIKAELIAKYGDDAPFLVVEALVEQGVVLSPIAKYASFNLRLCRPYGLTAADQDQVVEFAMDHVGQKYDFKNIFDLARYFLPVHMVPARFRKQALHFGSSDPTRVICSSLIAECFMRVRFPVVPRYEPFPAGFEPMKKVVSLFERFIRNRNGHHPPGLLRMVSPTLITPRDFDLSPYFAIVKYNVIESTRFDYQKLLWAEEPEARTTPKLEKSA